MRSYTTPCVLAFLLASFYAHAEPLKTTFSDTFVGCLKGNSASSDNKIGRFEYNSTEAQFEVCGNPNCGRYARFALSSVTPSLTRTSVNGNATSVNFSFNCTPLQQCVSFGNSRDTYLSIKCPLPAFRDKIRSSLEVLEFSLFNGRSIQIPPEVRNLVR
jgi:hypothetical protein